MFPFIKVQKVMIRTAPRFAVLAKFPFPYIIRVIITQEYKDKRLRLLCRKLKG